ncbi:MAG: peptidase U32 family protein [Chitinophagales bacterium]
MKADQIELMAPAGSFEALQAAIDNGANSVYFGIDQLNMRAVASINFTLDDLAEISRRCKEANVKTYITLNTIIYDHDLSVIKRIVDAAMANDISAIIAADQAVLNYAFTQGMEVHISTQLNVTNIETVKFYANFADVMVLSRELSIQQITKICDEVIKQDIRGPKGRLVEIEIFGHGALCMAVSGKCYLSLHSANSSANRGACKQNCRKKYTVKDEDGYELEIDNEYIMSPKDLCTLDFLDQIIESGIKVLKIEGRGRAADYVAKTIQSYREAIDAVYEGTYTKEKVEGWMNHLKSVYNREFWGGYFLGKKIGEWSDSPGSKATVTKVFVGKGMHYYKKPKIAQIAMKSHDIKIGDTILVTGPTTGAQEFVIKSMFVNEQPAEKAVKGDDVTIPVDFVVRASDKVYKMVDSKLPELV